MLSYRQRVRREVLEVNNQDALSPMERISYGIRVALSETEGAKIRREEKIEKEFVRNSELVKKYVIFIKSTCIEYFNQYKGGKLLILLDREVEEVLPQVLKNKNLKGYGFKLGYVDNVALKTRKKLRIPLYVTDLAE